MNNGLQLVSTDILFSVEPHESAQPVPDETVELVVEPTVKTVPDESVELVVEPPEKTVPDEAVESVFEPTAKTVTDETVVESVVEPTAKPVPEETVEPIVANPISNMVEQVTEKTHAIVKETLHVINLKSRQDRLDQIKETFSNIDFVDINPVIAIKYSSGWRGCALSHLKIIKSAMLANKPYVIVVEDDTELHNRTHFINQFPKIMAYLKEHAQQWDIYHGCVYGSTHMKNKLVDRSLKMCTVERGGTTTNFIIYNRSSYKYLNSLESMYLRNPALTQKTHAIDVLIIQSRLRRWTSVPFICIQTDSFSDIERQYTSYGQGILGTEKRIIQKLQLAPPKPTTPIVKPYYVKNKLGQIIKVTV